MRARRLSTDSLILSLIIAIVCAVVGMLTIDPLFAMLGAPADMMPTIRPFMMILYSAVPFIMLGMVGTASMRATGDTRLPSKLMIAAAILNVILDPILIFGLDLELTGAALASIVARFTIAGMALSAIHKFHGGFGQPSAASLSAPGNTFANIATRYGSNR